MFSFQWLMVTIHATNWNHCGQYQLELNLQFKFHPGDIYIYTGWPPQNGIVDTVDFSGLALINSYLFFTLLDRASFPYYNNTKIIKLG